MVEQLVDGLKWVPLTTGQRFDSFLLHNPLYSVNGLLGLGKIGLPRGATLNALTSLNEKIENRKDGTGKREE